MTQKWTFGIVTNGSEKENVLKICNSIYDLNIPKDSFEIRIVGGEDPKLENVFHKEFDETQKKHGWITRKKNIIFCEAQFPNISISHDYIKYHPNWYEGFLKFGIDWDVCMCKIATIDLYRYRDWSLWNCNPGQQPHIDTVKLLDYNDNTQTKRQYISGAYYCIKTLYAQQNQLNDSLCWGQGEDVEFSYRCRDTWNYKMNQSSIVQLLKEKERFPYTEERI